MHSVENMIAEVTLHNSIEMSKHCPKIAKNIPKISQHCPKLPKNDKNFTKLKGYPSNYIFHTVALFSKSDHEGGGVAKSSQNLITWFMYDPLPLKLIVVPIFSTQTIHQNCN